MPRDYSDMKEKEWRKIEPPMLPPRDVKFQAMIMDEVHHILDVIGLRHWLVDGALIHYVRDGELKPYNQDIDFACYAEEIKPMMPELRRVFCEALYDVRAYKNDTRLALYKYNEMASVEGYVLKGKYRYKKNQRIPAKYFENEERITVKWTEYKTPSIEKYLSWKYANWRKPYTGDTKNKKYLNKRKLTG